VILQRRAHRLHQRGELVVLEGAGSLRVDVFRPPAGAVDPSRIVDNNAIAESMYIMPRLFIPLLVVKLGVYAQR